MPAVSDFHSNGNSGTFLKNLSPVFKVFKCSGVQMIHTHQKFWNWSIRLQLRHVRDNVHEKRKHFLQREKLSVRGNKRISQKSRETWVVVGRRRAKGEPESERRVHLEELPGSPLQSCRGCQLRRSTGLIPTLFAKHSNKGPGTQRGLFIHFHTRNQWLPGSAGVIPECN